MRPPSDLLSSIPTPTGALAFVRDGDGLVGWGEYARLQMSGPDAAERIGEWFADEVAGLAVSDQVGTGQRSGVLRLSRLLGR